MNDEPIIDKKRTKIREQAGILLIVLTLAGSGYLLLNNGSKKSDINFVESKSPVIQTAGSTEKPALNSSQSASNSNAKTSAKININTASIEDLDKLPGVGPATAQKIIDYRTQNGPFKTIQDINYVSGIGDAKYSQMKDLISI